jgi:hypothetical protein
MRVALAVGFSFFSLAASGITIQCPQTIIEKPAVASANPAWSVIASSGERPVEHAGVYLGIGPEYGAQVPDSTKTSNREEFVSWKMPSGAAETFWIGCSYTGTTAMLIVKLKPDIASCVVTYARLPTGKRQHLKNIDCR